MCTFLACISESQPQKYWTPLCKATKRGQDLSECRDPLQQCSGLCRVRRKADHPGEPERDETAKAPFATEGWTSWGSDKVISHIPPESCKS